MKLTCFKIRKSDSVPRLEYGSYSAVRYVHEVPFHLNLNVIGLLCERSAWHFRYLGSIIRAFP